MMQSKAELLEQLEDQLHFIDASCQSYDAGVQREAKRLAVSVRVLLHDTGRSKSLLTHLGMKERTMFIEGMPEVIIGKITTARAGAFPGLAVIEIGPSAKPTYIPTFQVFPLGRNMLRFGRWWNDPRMSDPRGNKASRYDIVTWLANQDGGAHIDGLKSPYQALSRDRSMGFSHGSVDGVSVPLESPIPAAMRQIAEEVRVSIRRKIKGQ